jgi:predicted Zn-dependent protease
LCRCLEWSPAARFPNARVLLAEIDCYLNHGTTSAIESPATPHQPASTLTAPPPERVAADVEALLKSRRTDEALARVESALETHPRSMILLVTRASVLIRTGRFDTAKDALQAARAITPNAPEIDEATAEWYEAQGNPDAAAPFRKRALERQRSTGGRTPRFTS